MRRLVGEIDMNREMHDQLFSKIANAIAAGQKIKLLLDFDETLIHYERLVQMLSQFLYPEMLQKEIDSAKDPLVDFLNKHYDARIKELIHNFIRENRDTFINMHVMDFIASIYNKFGSHVTMEILSARKPDKNILPQLEYLMIATHFPRILELVGEKLGNEARAFLPTDAQVVKHCMMGWKRTGFYVFKEQKWQLAGHSPHYFMHDGNISNTAVESEIVKLHEELKTNYSPDPLRMMCEDLPKGYYLRNQIKMNDGVFYIHLDDNDWHLDDMRRMQLLNLETVRIVPTSGEVKYPNRREILISLFSRSATPFEKSILLSDDEGDDDNVQSALSSVSSNLSLQASTSVSQASEMRTTNLGLFRRSETPKALGQKNELRSRPPWK